jgi:hypothetical protein
MTGDNDRPYELFYMGFCDPRRPNPNNRSAVLLARWNVESFVLEWKEEAKGPRRMVRRG